MEWPKLKNIILLLLVTTNLCLMSFVVSREWKKEHQLQEARLQAMNFLEGRDVHIPPELIPKQLPLKPLLVERDRSLEQAAAKSLLGEGASVEEKGGEMYRYVNENGSIRFHADGAFSAELTPGWLPQGADRVETARRLLKKMGFEGELVEERGNTLVFRQSWEGVPLFSHHVTLVYREGFLTDMVSGRRLLGLPEEDPSRRPITVATALFDFYNGLGALGDVCSRVDQVSHGYVSVASLTGTTALVPVLRIETDTGSYQLDTLTGALVRLS